MPAQKVSPKEVKALLDRATRARLSIDEALGEAGISRVTWWRWTTKGAPLARFAELERVVAGREGHG